MFIIDNYYCPSSEENKYMNLEYDRNTIKYILKYFFDLKENVYSRTNYELFVMLIDIEDSLNSLSLTKKNKEVVGMYMKGFSETDIAEQYNVSRVSIHYMINRIVDKLVKKLED